MRVKTWPARQYSADHPPHEVFHADLPSIVDWAGLASGQRDYVERRVSSETRQLPTVSAVSAGMPIRSVGDLHLMQLIAAVHPRSLGRGSERAFLKSLRTLASLDLAPDDAKLLRARALMHLGRRPAALAALGEPRNAEQRALAAVLNGNLADARSATQEIRDPILAVLAQIELADMRGAYGVNNAESERAELSALVPDTSDWWPLLRRRVASAWDMESPVDLIGYLPLTPSQMEDLAKTLSAPGTDELATEVADIRIAVDAYDRSAATLRGDTDCGPLDACQSRQLVTDLIGSHIEADAMGRVRLELDRRGRIEHSQAVISALEQFMPDHPELMAARGRVAWKEYDRHRGKKRESWRAAALDASALSLWWLQYPAREITETERLAPAEPEATASLAPFRTAFFHDDPGYPYWYPRELRAVPAERIRYRDIVLANATNDYRAVRYVLDEEPDKATSARLEHALRGRFDGHPAVAKAVAEAKIEAGDEQAAERELRAAVADAPGNFDLRDRLAAMLADQGKFAEANVVYRDYFERPETAKSNRVGVSNALFDSGMLFWRVGQFDLGHRWLQESAHMDTGSQACLLSAAHLKVHEGRFKEAAGGYRQAAYRYGDLEAVNEYVELEFALGTPGQAWRIFDEVKRDGNGGKVLRTMVDGLRTQGKSDAEVREWLSRPDLRELTDGSLRYAAVAALSSFIVDRNPPADLAAWVGQLQGPTPYSINSGTGEVELRESPGAAAVRCGPGGYPGVGVKSRPGQSGIPSDLVSFAEAYVLMEHGESAAAHAVLVETARRFELFSRECGRLSYLAPYLALTAGATETKAVYSYLESVPGDLRRAHWYAARAAANAQAGRHREAIQDLDRAAWRWQPDRYRAVPTSYLIADIAERLFQKTSRAEYRTWLLKWVRVQQTLRPARAWPYALDARYDSGASKLRAHALALYLDPASRAIAGLSPEDTARAREWLGKYNPFLERSAPDGR